MVFKNLNDGAKTFQHWADRMARARRKDLRKIGYRNVREMVFVFTDFEILKKEWEYRHIMFEEDFICPSRNDVLRLEAIIRGDIDIPFISWLSSEWQQFWEKYT